MSLITYIRVVQKKALPSAPFYMQPYGKRKKADTFLKKRPPFKNFKKNSEPNAFLSSIFSTFQKSAGWHQAPFWQLTNQGEESSYERTFPSNLLP